MTAPSDGNGSGTAFISDFTETDPGFLAPFLGSGSVGTSVSVFDATATLASISSTFGTESLTYNYTPKTTAVPEPRSLALLAAGLFALGMLHCRKRAA
jgi:hypothetical protein